MWVRSRLLLALCVLALSATAQDADLVVVKSGPGTAAAGADVEYSLIVTNNGPANASAVSLDDPIPPGMTFVLAQQLSGPAAVCSTPLPGDPGTVHCDFASLASGASAELRFVFNIPSATAAGTPFTNTATVTTTATADPDGTNNTDAVVTTVENQADLSVTKTGPAEGAPASDVEYLVTVTNLGLDEALLVALDDDIPAGMTFVLAEQLSGPPAVCSTPAAGDPGSVHCDIATLAAGASAEFRFVFSIPETAEQGDSFTNFATASSGGSLDPNDENNTGVAVTTVPLPPQTDVFVDKSGPPSAGPDTDVTFIIVVGNGTVDAESLVLQDTLPGDLTFVSLEQSGVPLNCSTPAIGAGGTITCDAASYPAEGTTTLELVAHVPGQASSGTEYTNTALVSAANDQNEENNADSTSFFVSAVDLSVTKSGEASVLAGDDLTYTITIANSGPDNALGAQLLDTIPEGATFVSLTQTTGIPGSCEQPAPGGGGTVNCILTVPANGSVELLLMVNASPNATLLTNTATVTSEEFELDPSDNQDSVETTVIPSADVSVLKSGPGTAAAGSDITYTITVANDGPSAAADVTLTDSVPAQTAFVSFTQTSGPVFTCDDTVSCTIAALAADASATFELVVSVDSGASGAVENTASIGSTTSDPDSGDDQSAVTTTLFASAVVTVDKSGPASAAAGTEATYTITVTNNGPSDAAEVTLTDAVPAQTSLVSFTQTSGPAFTCDDTVACTLSTLPAGTSAVFELVVELDPSASGTVENTATVDSSTGPAASDGVSTTVIAEAALVVTKSGPASAVAGTNATYTITVTNDGPSDASGVTLVDAVPAQTSFVSFTQDSGPAFTCDDTVACSLATLAAGASAQFTFVVTVDPSATGTVENTATADSADSVPASDSVSTTVTAEAALVVTKSGPASAAAGTDVTYSITVSNNGPSDATAVTLVDAVPAQTSFVSFTQTAGPAFTCDDTVACSAAVLAAGASASFDFVVRVDPGATGTVDNTATADSADSLAVSDSVSTAVTAEVTLAVVKSGPPSAAAGSEVSYTITVTNEGPSDASAVTLVDAVPVQTTFVSFTQTSGPAFTCDDTVSCSLGVLPAAASATFDFVVRVDPGATGTVDNTATADSTDSAPASDQVSTALTSEAALAVTKNGPTSAAAGTAVTYTITVANNGPSNAANVTLTDPIPAQTTFVSLDQTAGPAFTCDDTVSCSIDVLPAASSATFELVVELDPAATDSVENTATADSPDAAPASDNATTTVTAEAVLAVTKDGPASVAAGMNATYTITVTNNGPSDAANVTLTDPVPAQTALVSFTQTAGPAFTCDDTVACSLAVLPAGSSATFELVVRVDPGATGTVENTATADSPDAAPASDGATTTVESFATVLLDKSGPADAVAGSDVTYTITLQSDGPSNAVNLTLTDAIPAQTSFVSFDQTAGPAFTCDASVTCTIATFPPSAVATFELTVRVDPGGEGQLENTAGVEGSNTAPATDTVTTDVGAESAVEVEKSGPAAAPAGTDVTYSVTVTNGGPSDAASVTLSDAVPAQTTFVSATQVSGPAFTCDETITCTIALLPNGASAAFEFTVRIDPGATGTVENVALVTSASSPSDSASVTTAVSESADLTVTKSGPAAAAASTEVTYTVTLTNAGPSNALDVVLSDPVPPQTTFVSAAQTAGPAFTCDETITCTIGVFPAGASAEFTFVFRVEGTASGDISNTATVSSSTPDPVPANSAQSVSTDVTAAMADLDVSKVADAASYPPGATATFTIVVTNDGPQTATNVTVTDALPAGTVLISATPAQGTCSGTSTVTCDVGTLANGESATITIAVTLPRNSGPLSNTATAIADQADPAPAGNSDTASFAIAAAAEAPGIPSLSPLALVLLAVVLAGAGVWASKMGA